VAVVPLAAHLPLAQATVQHAAQRAGAGPGVRRVLGLAAAPGEGRLGEGEVVIGDDQRVGLLLEKTHLSSGFQRCFAVWPKATFSTSSRTSTVRCRFHTW
jgi:hypothetical protein